MKRRFSSFIGMILVCAVTIAQTSISLLPKPQLYKDTGKNFTMGKVKLSTPVLRPEWEVFIMNAGGEIVEHSSSVIEVELVPSIEEARLNGAEAYRLSVSNKRIKIEAVTEQGVYWAMQTLRQLERKKGKRSSVAGCEIVDWPAFRIHENAEVSTMECQKLNRAYTGLMVRKEGEMLTPTINLNQLYEAYKAQPGVTMETVCRKIADIVIEAPIQVDLKSILNYEDVKDKLFIRVSSAEANKEVLENAPHQLKEDLAITYHVAVGKDQDGLSSMFIKNDLLEQYGISAEQLHEDAMKSSPHVMIPEVSSIGALIDEMYQKNILMLTPDEREMLQETLQESSEMPTFFVVTNTDRIDGAGVIFYPEFMDSMGELLGNDFFILPSSIHEMLVLPDDGQVDAEMLRDMVKEVNATQVAPAERLTNDVYHFDTKDHVFEKADRFTERQKEKEAQAAKTEKAGKEQPDQKPKTKKHDMEL